MDKEERKEKKEREKMGRKEIKVNIGSRVHVI